MAWCSFFFITAQVDCFGSFGSKEQLFENSFLSQLLQETEFREGLTKEMKTAIYIINYLIK